MNQIFLKCFPPSRIGFKIYGPELLGQVPNAPSFYQRT